MSKDPRPMDVRRREHKEFVKGEKAALEKIDDLGRRYPALRERFAEIVRKQLSRTWYFGDQDILKRLEAEVEKYLKEKPPQSN
jgi:hypothetical protein